MPANERLAAKVAVHAARSAVPQVATAAASEPKRAGTLAEAGRPKRLRAAPSPPGALTARAVLKVGFVCELSSEPLAVG